MFELLGREPKLEFQQTTRTLLSRSRVLVTGAGGSIGSEIVRQLESLEGPEVYLLDHDESALHAVQLELRGHGLLDDPHFVLADIRNRRAIARVMQEIRPEIVYHAAAHKHLPLLERFPHEGVNTNVFGTENVVTEAIEAGARLFVNVSTDKAAQPRSVLGLTKRAAEAIVSSRAGGHARVASVRFGNVLGSRGSLLHGLSRQLACGQAITVTDPHVTRFFMSIPEAAALVIEASALAECGETYVLDMGDPISVLKLIQRYAALAGVPEPVIRYTGLRSGEKLHEQLFDNDDDPRPTRHPRIFVIDPDPLERDAFVESLGRVRRLIDVARSDELVAALKSLLPHTEAAAGPETEPAAGPVTVPAAEAPRALAS